MGRTHNKPQGGRNEGQALSRCQPLEESCWLVLRPKEGGDPGQWAEGSVYEDRGHPVTLIVGNPIPAWP